MSRRLLKRILGNNGKHWLPYIGRNYGSNGKLTDSNSNWASGTAGHAPNRNEMQGCKHSSYQNNHISPGESIKSTTAQQPNAKCGCNGARPN